ncbi:MAG: type II secretion system F family protein [bacterium]
MLTAKQRESLYAGLAGAVRMGATAEAALSRCKASGDNRLAKRIAQAQRRAEEGLALSEALSVAFGSGLPAWEIAVIAAAEGAVDDLSAQEGAGEAVVSEVLDALSRYAAAERSAGGHLALSFGYAVSVLLLLAVVSAATMRLVLPSVESAVATMSGGSPSSLENARHVAGALPLAAGVVVVLGTAVPVALRAGGGSIAPRLLAFLPPVITDRLVGVIPATGALVRVLRISLHAGGDLVDALDLAVHVVLPDASLVGREVVEAARSGGHVSPALAARGWLPADLAERLAAAESWGDMEGALSAVEAELDRRRELFLEAMPRVGAAAATVVCGIFLGWFALAVVVPTLTALAMGSTY